MDVTMKSALREKLRGCDVYKRRQGRSMCLKKNAIVSGTQPVTWDIDDRRVAVLILEIHVII